MANSIEKTVKLFAILIPLFGFVFLLSLFIANYNRHFVIFFVDDMPEALSSSGLTSTSIKNNLKAKITEIINITRLEERFSDQIDARIYAFDHTQTDLSFSLAEREPFYKLALDVLHHIFPRKPTYIYISAECFTSCNNIKNFSLHIGIQSDRVSRMGQIRSLNNKNDFQSLFGEIAIDLLEIISPSIAAEYLFSRRYDPKALERAHDISTTLIRPSIFGFSNCKPCLLVAAIAVERSDFELAKLMLDDLKKSRDPTIRSRAFINYANYIQAKKVAELPKPSHPNQFSEIACEAKLFFRHALKIGRDRHLSFLNIAKINALHDCFKFDESVNGENNNFSPLQINVMDRTREEIRLQRSDHYLRKALIIRPHIAEAHLELGINQYRRGNYLSAIPFYYAAIGINPHQPVFYGRLGYVQNRIANTLSIDNSQITIYRSRAKENYRKRLSMVGNSHIFWLDYAVSQLRFCQIDEALDSIKRALSFRLEYDRAYFYLAKIYEGLGDIRKAWRYYNMMYQYERIPSSPNQTAIIIENLTGKKAFLERLGKKHVIERNSIFYYEETSDFLKLQERIDELAPYQRKRTRNLPISCDYDGKEVTFFI